MGGDRDLPRARPRSGGGAAPADPDRRALAAPGGRDPRRLPRLPRGARLPHPARIPVDRPRDRGTGEEAADLRLRLRGLGERQPAVPGAERQVRDHREAERAGEQPSLPAQHRGRRPRRAHGQPARAPDRGDHRAHPDLLPPARRPGDVPAGDRRGCRCPSASVPAASGRDRRGRQGLRQRQPGAGDRRRSPHLGLPRDRGLPPRAPDGGPGGVPRPDPVDRADGRRGRRWRWCW